ncbi:hypothetical protein N8148_03260 [Gammaproteobacteria bacterium]|nr:hypothetical protein [Gammaproteobacteria bacterium]
MAILTSRTELAAKPADTDLIHVVDVSDVTDAASGTSKKITAANLKLNLFDTTVNDSTDITEGTDKNFISDAEAVVLGNTSGTNTGDVTLAGTGTYLSLIGQAITVDPITESDISDLQAYLLNLVEDTTPQLGGDLDAQSMDITAVDNFQFDTSPTTPLTAEGSMYWDATNHTIAMKTDNADPTLQIGQENWIRVYNGTGSQIDNGSVVYATGKEDTEDRLTIGLAQADASNTSRVIGFATHDIANGAFGYVTQFGYVNDLNTASITDGSPVWLSATSAGGFTDVEPESPNVSVFLGFVVDSHASTGNIFITTLGNTSGTTLASDATQIVQNARKGSAGTINKGDAVYISGFNVGQGVVEVEFADADSASTMPAFGIANDTITNSTNGQIVLSGRIANIDTSSYSVNDSIYISTTGTTGNTLTNVKPAGPDTLIQKVGNVARSNASNGVIIVVGAGRTNDVPNTITPTTYTPTGTTQTITFANYDQMAILDLGSATGDVTLTLSGMTAGGAYTMKVIQGATARNLIFPASVIASSSLAAWTTADQTLVMTAVDDSVDVVGLTYDGTSTLMTAEFDLS